MKKTLTIQFINNRLISLDEKYFKHHMFFKKLQIILNDIPKIDYGIKNKFIKGITILEEINCSEYHYHFKYDNISCVTDDHFYFENERYVKIIYYKGSDSMRYYMNTKYGRVMVGY